MAILQAPKGFWNKRSCIKKYQSWIFFFIKKTESQRIDAFELWCWRRLLRVPWTARRSNQLLLKEINPEYSLERLMLKLQLQYFGHLMQRSNSWEKTLVLGRIEGRRRREREDEMVGWHHRLNGHELQQAPGDGEGQGSPACCSLWGPKESDTTERLNNNLESCLCVKIWSYLFGFLYFPG